MTETDRRPKERTVLNYKSNKDNLCLYSSYLSPHLHQPATHRNGYCDCTRIILVYQGIIGQCVHAQRRTTETE